MAEAYSREELGEFQRLAVLVASITQSVFEGAGERYAKVLPVLLAEDPSNYAKLSEFFEEIPVALDDQSYAQIELANADPWEAETSLECCVVLTQALYRRAVGDEESPGNVGEWINRFGSDAADRLDAALTILSSENLQSLADRAVSELAITAFRLRLLGDSIDESSIPDSLPADIESALRAALELLHFTKTARRIDASLGNWIYAGRLLPAQLANAEIAIRPCLEEFNRAASGVITCGLVSDTNAFHVLLELAAGTVEDLEHVKMLVGHELHKSDRDRVEELMQRSTPSHVEWRTLHAWLRREAIEVAKHRVPAPESAVVPQIVEMREGNSSIILRTSDGNQVTVPEDALEIFKLFAMRIVPAKDGLYTPTTEIVRHGVLNGAAGEPGSARSSAAHNTLRKRILNLNDKLGQFVELPNGAAWIVSRKRRGYFFSRELAQTVTFKIDAPLLRDILGRKSVWTQYLGGPDLARDTPNRDDKLPAKRKSKPAGDDLDGSD